MNRKHIQNNTKKHGFTMIELLIVIAIIGILAVLGISMFSSATKRARDAVRKSDLESIRQALVLYRSDNGTYPQTSGISDVVLTPMLSPTYINPVPEAETPNLDDYNYTTLNGGRQFKICTKLETNGGNYGGDELGDDCVCDGVNQPRADYKGCCFCVFSP